MPQLSSFIQACTNVGTQSQILVNALGAKDYYTPNREHSSIGMHVRHIVEYMHCLCEGVIKSEVVNYDARPRDRRMEMDKDYAISRLEELKASLNTLLQFNQEYSVTIIEHMDVGNDKTIEVQSTLARELLFQHSHAVHHFGIIKLLAEKRGINLDTDFGKAPSTIMFERQASQ
jgi:hypothetical protein